jgi:hypothetical protein
MCLRFVFLLIMRVAVWLRLSRREDAPSARDADVDVILDITAGAPHVFQVFVGTLDEADQALGRAALFLTQHLAGKRAD